MENRTTLQIESKTRDKLELAKKPKETYDQLLNRLADSGKRNKEKDAILEKILASTTFQKSLLKVIKTEKLENKIRKMNSE